jgi:hypothetical protein
MFLQQDLLPLHLFRLTEPTRRCIPVCRRQELLLQFLLFLRYKALVLLLLKL